MTSPKTWSNLVHGLELAFPDIPVANIARRFGVTVDAVNRNRAHYDNRLRTQQGCAVFNSAPDFKTFIADPHNFRLLTGELCLGAYIHNTLRHAEARALHATIDVVPGITHAADAAHRHHLEHDPRSIVAGSDRTVEGALLRKIRRFQVDVAPPSEKASLAAKAEPKFFDLVAPSIDEADRAVDRIDIENPDPLQRMVGDVAASAPLLAASAVHPAAGAAVAGGSGAEVTYRDAKAHGATDEQAEDAALWALPLNVEIALIPGGRILDEVVPGARGAPLKIARDYANRAAASAAMTGGMRVGDNIAARATFDPHRDAFDNADRSALSGAIRVETAGQ